MYEEAPVELGTKRFGSACAGELTIGAGGAFSQYLAEDGAGTDKKCSPRTSACNHAKAKVTTRTNKVSAVAIKKEHVALKPTANADGQAMLLSLWAKTSKLAEALSTPAALSPYILKCRKTQLLKLALPVTPVNKIWWRVNNAVGELPQVAATSLSRAKPLFTILFAPDRPVVAQGDVQVTPIPPVVTGIVDLEEFKSTNILDLKVSQSVLSS